MEKIIDGGMIGTGDYVRYHDPKLGCIPAVLGALGKTLKFDLIVLTPDGAVKKKGVEVGFGHNEWHPEGADAIEIEGEVEMDEDCEENCNCKQEVPLTHEIVDEGMDSAEEVPAGKYDDYSNAELSKMIAGIKECMRTRTEILVNLLTEVVSHKTFKIVAGGETQYMSSALRTLAELVDLSSELVDREEAKAVHNR